MLLIRREIAAKSVSSYWERTDPFVGLRLEGRGLRHLSERQPRASRL